MKILLSSHRFFPEIGGIETMTDLLARQWTELGHQVIVVTATPYDGIDEAPYRVVRQPTRRHLLRLTRWCELFFHNNISLQTAWPLFLVRRPWGVVHQTWIARNDGTMGAQDKMKKFLSRFAINISISHAVAEHLGTPSTVIGNPYRDQLFFEMPAIERDRELVFLGRLVSDKGLKLLLDAMSILRTRGLAPTLTIIGDGPELENLQQQARELELNVNFVGAKKGDELRILLNRHRILVVPSLWNEPFGIAALEGIACGCVVVGSAGGGLKDAIGPCGLTFPNGDVTALADALEPLVRDANALQPFRDAAPAHLQNYRAERVARAYLEVIEGAVT